MTHPQTTRKRPMGPQPARRRSPAPRAAWLFGLLGLALAACSRTEPSPPPADDSGEIAVMVNDEPIYQHEVQAAMNEIIALAPANVTSEQIRENIPQIRGEAIENLIRDRLIGQEIEARGIEPGPADLQQEIEALQGFLDLQQITLDEHLETMGLTREEFDRQLRNRIAANTLFDQLLDLPNPNEQQLRDFYEEHRDRYTWPRSVLVDEIRLAWPEDSAEGSAERQAVMERALTIRQRLAAGGSFEQLARELSESETAASGGEIGWLVEETMLPAARAAIADLNPGQVTQPLETTNGVYLVRLRERRPQLLAEFDAVRESVESDWRNLQRFEKVPPLLDRMRAEADIVEF